MKKMLVFLLVIILNVGYVNAKSDLDYSKFNKKKDPNNILTYDISKFDVSSDMIKVEGWAFLNKVNTIGGDNYKVSLVVLKEKDLDTYRDGGTVSYYRKTVSSNNYTGANNLYSSLCFDYEIKNTDGKRYCGEVFFGYGTSEYDDSTVGSDGSKIKPQFDDDYNIKSNVSYASCKYKLNGASVDDTKTSCIHYNPYFSLNIYISEIYKKLKYTDSDSLIFLIEIDYNVISNISIKNDIYKNPSGCYYNYSKSDYVGCSRTPNKNVARVLVVDKVKKSNGGFDIEPLIVRKFRNLTNYGKIREGIYENGEVVGVDYIGNSYVLENGVKYIYGNYYSYLDTEDNVFNVNLDNTISIPINEKATPGGGGELKYLSINYNSKGSSVKNNDDGINSNNENYDKDYYHDSNGSAKGYIAVTWGVREGYISLKINPPLILPDDENCNYNPVVECGTELSDSCSKKLFISLSGEDFSVINNLNEPVCRISGKNATVKIYKFFRFEENISLKYNEDLFKSNGKNWPGLKMGKSSFGFQFENGLDYYPDDNYEIYYSVRYYYNSSTDPDVITCEEISEDRVVSYDYLVNNGINNISSFYSDDDFKHNFNSLSLDFKYSYPNSNDIGSNYTEKDSKKVINSIDGFNSSYLESTVKTFTLKDSYINKYNGKIIYRDSVSDDSWEKVNNYYYIPLNAKNGDKLEFVTTINNVSRLVSGVNIKNVCPYDVFDGNLETYKYRVIDLSNPFPNNPPESSGYASNWYKLWENNSKFNSGENKGYLLSRKENEYYKLDLNVSKIRDYNVGKLYLNTKLNNDNESSFIRNSTYFNKRDISSNLSKKPPGESGVEG